MIVLYGSATSPNVLKVRTMLEAAEIPYEERRVKREEGENRTPEFLEISATGTLPAIVDDETGACVFESSAILLYLGDKAGKFFPEDVAKRADVYKWLIFEASNISPVIEAIYKLYYLDEDWIPGAIEFHKSRLVASLAVIKTRLGVSGFLAGDCSIADFALLPLTNLLEDFLEQPISDFPHLQRWSQGLLSQPAVQRAFAAPRSN